MKVLLVNTPQSPQFRGGDLVQMTRTAEALRELGAEVTECFDASPAGAGFDVAHVFNLRTLSATRRQVASLAAYGIPIALSPIYLNVAYPLWGTVAVDFVLGRSREETELEPLLNELRTHRLRPPGRSGEVYAATAQNRTQPEYDRIQRSILSQVDYLLPNSFMEMTALARTLSVYHLPFSVVPYAADPSLFLSPDPQPFIDRYGLSDFVLQVGRVELSKNQLMLCRALRGNDLPLVLIGQQLQTQYAAACRRHGPKRLTMLPHLSPQELQSAYAAARVHALPSWVETCGLVSLEAALADCNLVVSTAGYELEYVRGHAYYCQPASLPSIRHAVLTAHANFAVDGARREQLRRLILEEYSWQRAAETCLSAYQQMLVAARRPRTMTQALVENAP